MKSYALGFMLLIATSAFAQEKKNTTDTTTNYSKFKRNVVIKGLLQTRYSYSFTKDVNVEGKSFQSTDASKDRVTNAFQIKRARVQALAQINDRWSANFRVNLAEFNSPTGQVLEHANLTYKHNKWLNITAGQQLMQFGTEDKAGGDLIKSLDYSNQYTAFKDNGWQNYQIGATLFGNIAPKDAMPLRYYVGAYNGTGRNPVNPGDNDNYKNYSARLEKDLKNNTTLGINAALGSKNGNKGYAWGADATTIIPLDKKWKLELNGEYKFGTNYALLKSEGGSATTGHSDIDSCLMQGFFFFPNLRYEINTPRLRAIEFSSRYEFFNNNIRYANNSSRQTITPMFNFEFADEYFARLQVGAVIDLYKNNVTATPNRTMGVVQLQVRF